MSFIFQPQEMNVDEMVSTLNDLESVAPSKEAYNSLCLLLAYPKLCDHMDYKHWNPSNARFVPSNAWSGHLTSYATFVNEEFKRNITIPKL